MLETYSPHPQSHASRTITTSSAGALRALSLFFKSSAESEDPWSVWAISIARHILSESPATGFRRRRLVIGSCTSLSSITTLHTGASSLRTRSLCVPTKTIPFATTQSAQSGRQTLTKSHTQAIRQHSPSHAASARPLQLAASASTCLSPAPRRRVAPRNQRHRSNPAATSATSAGLPSRLAPVQLHCTV